MSDRVVVTGITGFIGPHLARALIARGVEVHALTRPGSHLERIPDLLDAVTVHHDTGSTSDLVAVIEAIQPSTCFHLATHFVAQHEAADVDPLIEANLAFPMRLAEALARSGCGTFVNTGTSWQHVDGEAYRPKNLYAATKQAFDDVIHYYARSGAFRVCTMVLFDTYGPGDHRPKLIAALREALRTGEPLLMNSGDPLIDLVHVDDVITAFDAGVDALEHVEAPEQRYAVSSGAPLRVRDLVDLVGDIQGEPVPVVWGARPDRPDEMMTPWAVPPPPPGWAPQVTLETGLRQLLDH